MFAADDQFPGAIEPYRGGGEQRSEPPLVEAWRDYSKLDVRRSVESWPDAGLIVGPAVWLIVSVHFRNGMRDPVGLGIVLDSTYVS